MMQYLGLLCTSLWNVDQSWGVVLEAPQLPFELCLVVDVHPHGSVHFGSGSCFLRDYDCSASFVSGVSSSFGAAVTHQ